MNPYLDDDIGHITQKKKRSLNGADSAVSFDSAVTPPAASNMRIRAATMMRDTKVTKPLKSGLKGSDTMFENNQNPYQNRKSSVDAAALKLNHAKLETSAVVMPSKAALKLDESSFRLPNLGRTVSHSMTPAALRSQPNQQFEPYEDQKLRQQIAKQSFMQIDDKTYEAFRNNKGRTPMAQQKNS